MYDNLLCTPSSSVRVCGSKKRRKPHVCTSHMKDVEGRFLIQSCPLYCSFYLKIIMLNVRISLSTAYIGIET